jgi:hypothetical protein
MITAHKVVRNLAVAGLLGQDNVPIVMRDTSRWEVDTERDTSKFDAACYWKLLEKAWEEVAFVPLRGIYN